MGPPASSRQDLRGGTKISATVTSISATGVARLTRGVRGRVPALVVAVQRDVQAEVLRQAVVIAVPEHVRVVACQHRVNEYRNN